MACVKDATTRVDCRVGISVHVCRRPVSPTASLGVIAVTRNASSRQNGTCRVALQTKRTKIPLSCSVDIRYESHSRLITTPAPINSSCRGPWVHHPACDSAIRVPPCLDNMDRPMISCPPSCQPPSPSFLSPPSRRSITIIPAHASASSHGIPPHPLSLVWLGLLPLLERLLLPAGPAQLAPPVHVGHHRRLSPAQRPRLLPDSSPSHMSPES